MKFLCDRCKTRYSIGDDRVRGKILKIRCKNCQNVITVREGMSEDAAAADGNGARRGRPTTAAPAAQSSGPIPGLSASALGAAFAQQMTRPPPALEEEWYVSRDGNQEGPFSLAEAQRWVANKPFDAELHCWSEGFDDWLVVEKVSHFRNLRKRPPAPSAPPPLPRIATRPAASDDEPKPLFAATMASLEKSAPATSGAFGLPAIQPAPTVPAGVVVTPNAASARSNGTATPIVAKGTSTSTPAVKSTAVPSAMAGGALTKSGGVRATTTPGVATAAPASRVRLFDDSEGPADSATQIESPIFGDDHATAEPGAGKRGFGRGDDLDPAVTAPGAPTPMMMDAARNSRTGAANSAAMTAPMDAADHGDGLDENLEIGEVSRVVNLADLARSHSKQKAQAQRLRATGPLAKLPPAGDPKAPAPVAGGALAPVPGEVASDSIVAPLVAKAHRRGLAMLLGVAALVLIAVVGVVVLVVTTGDGGLPMGLGRAQQIDTTRPEDIIRKGASDPVPTPGSATPPPTRPQIHRPQIRQGSATPTESIDPTKSRLEAEEVEDLVRKSQNGIDRCYMRAQKGVAGIEVGDVRKIAVTMDIDKDGYIKDVQLSDHGGDVLGKCLAQRIKLIKFRQSQAGGTFRIVLAAPAG